MEQGKGQVKDKEKASFWKSFRWWLAGGSLIPRRKHRIPERRQRGTHGCRFDSVLERGQYRAPWAVAMGARWRSRRRRGRRALRGSGAPRVDQREAGSRPPGHE